jgi:signal transduction histidine kinase
MPSPRPRPIEIVVGAGGSLAVLVALLLRPVGWDVAAVVLATLLPASLVLFGLAAARRARELAAQQAVLVEQREGIAREAADAERSRAQLADRMAELVTLNELGGTLSSTLDLDELLDRALAAVVTHLPFDRALIYLVEEASGRLIGGRSIGGDAEMAGMVAGVDVSLTETRSTIVQLALADGPMLFRGIDEDPYEPNRAFAAAVGATSFLGTPLVTKGRTVGVLAVDNRLSGRELERAMGPLLFTLGNLLAAAIENARLYAELEASNRDLEARVARRTAQLADATEEAQAARAAAEAASATKSSFLANVSHELRTPLTSVVGFTKIVRRRLEEVVFPVVSPPAGAADRADGAEAVDPKVERAMRQVSENLAIMVAEGDRLTAMINDVLDLEKIEAGRMEFKREPVDVAEVVERASAATAALFETTGLALVLDVDSGLPTIEGDRSRLIQVLINLLSNAVKFTPSGSVTVRARAEGDGSVRVDVVDTGVGIEAADHGKVFEPFGQAGDTLVDKPRGTGLGLPICREIVEHHGGRLWLESAVGHGSTFAFTLPVTSAAAPRSSSRSA